MMQPESGHGMSYHTMAGDGFFLPKCFMFLEILIVSFLPWFFFGRVLGGPWGLESKCSMGVG